jgi:hypothetical protein
MSSQTYPARVSGIWLGGADMSDLTGVFGVRIDF